MDETGVESPVESAVALLRAAVDGLLSCGLTGLTSPQVTELLAGVEQQRRRLEAVDQRLLAEADTRRLAGDYARTSTTDLLITLLRVSPGEARARINRSLDLAPRHALDGQPLEPTFPLVSAAVAEGAVSAAHVEMITDCLDRIPSVFLPDAVPVAEDLLVQVARHSDPCLVARTGRELLARLDPDGTAPTDTDRHRRRALHLTEHRDGGARLAGELTAECAAVWRPIIDALSQPEPAGDNPDGGASERDERSPGQRRHDGFLDAGRRLLRSGTLPDSGGVPVTVLVTLPGSRLTAPAGHARTAHGDLISVPEMLHAAPEAQLVPVTLAPAIRAGTGTDSDTRRPPDPVGSRTGGVLAYGRTRRYASPGQRLALAARDGGCAFPDCTRPAAWCEAHHVIPWWNDGPTDLSNLVLLCGFHHREFEPRGWVITMSDGVPLFIPPQWLDPHQRPRRNTAHHLPDIDFGHAG